jgi:hypothetical protein
MRLVPCFYVSQNVVVRFFRTEYTKSRGCERMYGSHSSGFQYTVLFLEYEEHVFCIHPALTLALIVPLQHQIQLTVLLLTANPKVGSIPAS